MAVNLNDTGVFFLHPDQWVVWVEQEMNMLPSQARSPQLRHLFNRWCVSHVSTDEVLAALDSTVSINLFSIHERIKKNRADLLALGGK